MGGDATSEERSIMERNARVPSTARIMIKEEELRRGDNARFFIYNLSAYTYHNKILEGGDYQYIALFGYMCIHVLA